MAAFVGKNNGYGLSPACAGLVIPVQKERVDRQVYPRVCGVGWVSVTVLRPA